MLDSLASGLADADAGFGLEPPARQFRLDFVPLARERYVLRCQRALLGTAALERVLALLRNNEFRGELDSLPGYDAAAAGCVTPLQEAFPHP